MNRHPTPPETPLAKRRASVPLRVVRLADGRLWASEAAYPLTVALLELWARPWSPKALRRASWRVWIAMGRGLPSVLDT